MYYIEAKNQIDKNEELQNGDVIVTQTALPKKKIKKKIQK